MHSPTLAQLLETLRTITFRRWEALPRVWTLDGLTWYCVCVDAGTLATRGDLPYGSGASELEAVHGVLAEVARLDARDPDPAELDPFNFGHDPAEVGR